MRYREMIKKVQQYSGLTDNESENALISFIKLLSLRLNPDERMDFASQLPAELQDTVVSMDEPEKNMSMEEMLVTLSDEQNIDEDHARKQIMASWQSLKEVLSNGEIEDMRLLLPHDISAQLS